MPTITGDNNNNNLTGTIGDDSIQGLGGNDTLEGGDGNDTLDGGAGNDSLNGGAGVNTLIGGDGDDTLVNGFGEAYGGTGNDVLRADYTGLNYANLGIYNDANRIRSFWDTNSFIYFEGIERFNIIGTLFNDFFTVNQGDSFDAIGGVDRLNLNFQNVTAAVNLDLSQTTNLSIAGTVARNFEQIGTIRSGAGNDTFTLGSAAFAFDNDTSQVYGGLGTDTLVLDYTNLNYANRGIYNDSNRIRSWWNTNSFVYFEGVERFNITGSKFDDWLSGRAGDSLDGGAGNDRLYLDVADVTGAVNLNLTVAVNTPVNNTRITNFEQIGTIRSGAGNDTFTLGSAAFAFDNDTSQVYGGLGTDTLVLDYTNLNYANRGIYNDSNRIRSWWNTNSFLYFEGVERFNITGSKFDDWLSGRAGDSLDGGAGNDRLYLDVADVTGAVNLNLTVAVNTPVNNTRITNFEQIGTITSGGGNDIFTLGAAAFAFDNDSSQIYGGTGRDTLVLDYTNLNYANRGIYNDSNRIRSWWNTNSFLYFESIEQLNIIGSQFNDRLAGSFGDTLDGNGGNDTINGGNGLNRLIGGAGNDGVNGGSGNDLIVGVDPYSTTAGLNEIDTLSPGAGSDTIVLGNNIRTFYDDNNTSTAGIGDYALIQNFNITQDVIQLFGARTNYQLGLSPIAGITGTAIYRTKTAPEPQELIAIIQDIAPSQLNLNGSYFVSAKDEIAFDSSVYRVVEDGSTQASVNVTRTFGNQGPLTITVNFTGGTATAGQDYIGTPITVSFNNGEFSKAVAIPLIDDSVFEGSETVNMQLSYPTGGTVWGQPYTAVLTIAEEAIINFSSPTYTVNENGTGQITLNRSGSLDGAISLRLNMTNGTAVSPGDYNNNPINVTFAPNEISKVVSIPIVNDNSREGDETFNISLSNSTGATIGLPSSAVMTIADDDIGLAAEYFDGYFRDDVNFFNQNQPVLMRTDRNLNFIDSSSSWNLGNSVLSDYETYSARWRGFINIPVPGNYTFSLNSDDASYLFLGNAVGSPAVGNATIDNGGEHTTREATAQVFLQAGFQPVLIMYGENTINNVLQFSWSSVDAGISKQIVPDSVLFTPNTVNVSAVLSFAAANYTVNEGSGAVSIRIDRTGRMTGAVSAVVNSSNGTAIAPGDYNNTPITVNFLDGETSKTVTIPIVNDTIAENVETIALTLSDPTGGATLGTQTAATVSITDDDTAIGFSAGNYTVRENGTAVTDIIVTRSGKIDITSTFTLTFTDGTATGCGCAPSSVTNDFNNVPFNITFAPGETSKIIPVSLASLAIGNSIAIRDDTKLEGDETFTIKITDPVGATVGNNGSAVVTIKDDEAAPTPVLSLLFDKDVVNETAGNGAIVGTIFRNIVTGQDLVINLTSSDTTEATVVRQIVIPANQASATFSINAINDNIVDGAQPVTITAAAAGYTSVSRGLTVTDAPVGNLADLVITTFTATTPLLTGQSGSFTYRITNAGAARAVSSAAVPLVDRVYLSADGSLDSNDTLLGEYNFIDRLDPTVFYQRTNPFFIPRTPGQYNLIVVTDVTNIITESSEGNNTRVLPVTVRPSYRVVVSTDTITGIAGQPVILKGTASANGNNAPVPYEFVTIAVRLNGTTRELTAFTDANGNFTRTFNPLPGEAGDYTINAYFPGFSGEDTVAEDSFKLLGMKFNSDPINLKVIAARTVTGQLILSNLTSTALDGLTASIEGAPADWTINATTSPNLAGNGQNTVNYTITIPNSSAITQDTFNLKISSGQGATAILPISIELQKLVPQLVASTSLLTSPMLRGNQTIVEFSVTNTGGAIAQNIGLQLPNTPWMRLISPNNFNLAIGETTKVSLLLAPDESLPLTQYNGNVLLDAVGNNDLTLPFRFQAVSSAVGNIQVSVVDELFFFASGSPKLAGATVILKNYFTGEEITRGVTTDTGLISFTGVGEGVYKIAVSADGHDAFEKGIQLDAGETEVVNSFLSKQTVKYIWNVTPTQIQDQYDIKVESVFETDVPIPTLVLEPSSIDLKDLQVVGQVMQVNMTAANYGLIAVNNVRFNFGSHPFYRIEPLITEIGTVGAKASITVPVRITRIADFTGADPSIPCSINASLVSSYLCGPTEVVRTIPIPIFNVEGNCNTNILSIVGAYGTLGGTVGGVVPVVVNLQSSDCDPAVTKTLKAIADCAVGSIPLPNPLACAIGVKTALDATIDGATFKEAFDSTITALDCSGKLPVPIGLGLTLIDCLDKIISAYNSLNSSTVTANNYTRGLITYINRLRKVADAQTFLWGDNIWFRDNDGVELLDWTVAFQARITSVSEAGNGIATVERNALLALPLPGQVSATDVNKFIDRWNRSVDYWNRGIFNIANVPAGQSTDFIAINTYRDSINSALDAINQSKIEGFDNIYDGAKDAVDRLQQALQGTSSGVCARVRLQINQEAVMTRDAFSADLEIDNGGTTVLTNISVNLQVKDANGNVVNSLFGITDPSLKNITAVNGSGILTADNQATPQNEGIGSAQWTFIPSTGAAGDVPRVYTIGGTLSYVENGKTITVPLLSTPVTVYPQAELVLDYFQERNVYGDDPFTTPVEISVPFSLGVLVRNTGKGEARNLQITSAQPKIIDNDKGLLVNFDIIGSEVNGGGVVPSLSVNFGNIAPGGTAVADWLLKSSLQGKFIDYQASFQHVNGLGIPELSLVKDVKIRELTRKVQVTQPTDDGVPDFLVNDIFDARFYPDTLYFSNGTTAPVAAVDNGTIDAPISPNDRTVVFTATVNSGWTYFRLPDPGNGQYILQSLRRLDGTPVSSPNIWTTDRTFPATGRPTYENILHFLDNNATAGVKTYTIVYAGNPLTPSIILNQSNGGTGVVEGGAGDSYTLVLNSRPTGNVTVNLNTGTNLTLNLRNITFTPTNWNVPRTINVAAVDDTIAQGNYTATITHTVTSTDPNYNGFSLTPVTVNITDNDVVTMPTVTVSLAPGSVTENGSQNLIYTFTRTGSTVNPLTVNFILQGTAIPTRDYAIRGATVNNRAGQITFAPGAASTNLTIDPNGDNTVENDESVILTLDSGTGYTIGANVPLTGTINNDDGDAGDNLLNGSPGNDSLDGGIGRDTMIGGGGNDIYVVDNPLDVVTENPNSGTDTINATVDEVLPDNVENLTLLGAANLQGTGNTLNNVLIGNSSNNILRGLGGDDTLDGGAGIDTLEGGTGNDTYTVDNLGDTVTEMAGEGTDTLRTPFGFNLAGSNVENLVLIGADNVNGGGDGGNNSLTGNGGNNTLSGFAGDDTLNGGAGADTMIGGAGNDFYFVDNIGDVVTENINEGVDTISSTLAFNLTATNVENLNLLGSTNINGTGDDRDNVINGNEGINLLTGNAGNDTLTGGAGNDSLSGGLGNDSLSGGLGNDSLSGGLGNDSYLIDAAGDAVIENPGEGNDTIRTTVSFNLTNTNVENLILVVTSNINGTGNASNNLLIGNEGANILTGNEGDDIISGAGGNDTLIGGSGSDNLAGGAGSDTFVFNLPLQPRDLITDFNPVDDTIALTASGFGFPSTTLDPSVFRSGDGAISGITSNQRLIYNTANGVLNFDPDGNGPAAGIQLASLNNRPVITAADFVLI